MYIYSIIIISTHVHTYIHTLTLMMSIFQHGLVYKLSCKYNILSLASWETWILLHGPGICWLYNQLL